MQKSSFSGADAKRAEVDAAKDPREALKWNREALNFLCAYSIDQGYDYKFALEAKPNEPTRDICLPTTGAMLGFIATLDHSKWSASTPKSDTGTNVGIKLLSRCRTGNQKPASCFTSISTIKKVRVLIRIFVSDPRSIKNLFFLVKLLEESYDGPRHFDAHSYSQ